MAHIKCKIRVHLFVVLLTCFSFGLKAQIIPQPLKITNDKGGFLLTANAIIGVDKQSHAAGTYLQEYLEKYYHLHLQLKEYTQVPAVAAIKLITENTREKEHYGLRIGNTGINIQGSDAGVFYGVQSLIQLLPGDATVPLKLAACTIEDAPRFKWRGLSLDVCRHFFTVDEVKKYIDMMAHYKLNVLHWHLTDDEGWRIQIDKYPLLTEVGAKISFYAKQGKFRPLDNLVGEDRDGFYTKSDIKEVLQYATERHITILPEIEMPGHSEAAIFAYPELGCQDSTGAKHRVRMLDPSEHTFTFLEDVLSEVMALFPNNYIHIGGDEAEMSAWLKSPVAVALMKKEGLKNEKEVQSYFIKRMEKFLLEHHKKLIGWDEILQGGLAESATVMSWRGEAGGIAAAKMHHPVVMTPLPQMYFDAPQDDEALEPIGWNPPVTWQMVYNYEPVPQELNATEAAYVLGVQGNIWTEKIPNMPHLEYMIYPRALALSEIAWTPKDKKNIAIFERKMDRQYNLFKLWGLNARLPDTKGMTSIVTNSNTFTTVLTNPLKGAIVKYSLNRADTVIKTLPVKISVPLKDTLSLFTRTSWTLNAQMISQKAFIKRVVVNPLPLAPGSLKKGLSYARFTVPEYEERNLDSIAADSSGVMRAATYTGIREEDKMVKVEGYLLIDTEADYEITSGLETSAEIDLAHVTVISGNNNMYVTPQKAALHLKKGYYPVKIIYRPRADHPQPLFQVRSAGELDLATHLFY